MVEMEKYSDFKEAVNTIMYVCEQRLHNLRDKEDLEKDDFRIASELRVKRDMLKRGLEGVASHYKRLSSVKESDSVAGGTDVDSLMMDIDKAIYDIKQDINMYMESDDDDSNYGTEHAVDDSMKAEELVKIKDNLNPYVFEIRYVIMNEDEYKEIWDDELDTWNLEKLGWEAEL